MSLQDFLLAKLKRILESNFLIFCIVLIFWTLFFWKTNIFTSGFHLTDDHELIRINYDLGSKDLFTVLTNWIINDLSIRLRPAYFAIRVVVTSIFQTNFLYYYILNVLLATTTTVSLFATARKIGIHQFFSLIFALLVVVGPQSAVWWRLGPNETWGITLLSLGMFFLVSFNNNNKILYYISALTLIFLSSLTKESFLVSLPFVAIVSFALCLKYKSFKQTIIWGIKYLSPMLIIFSAGLYVVLARIGTNTIGYAGTGSETFQITSLAKAFLAYVSIVPTVPILLLLLLLTLIYIYKPSNKLYVSKSEALLFCSFLVLLASQIVLYSKSGAFERYLIPGVIAITATLTLVITIVIRSYSVKHRRIISAAFLLIILFHFIPNLYQTYSSAKNFSAEGRMTNEAINTITDNSNPDEPLLLVAETAGNFEWAFSLHHYLSDNEGYQNIIIFPITLNPDSADGFSKGLSNIFLDQFPDSLTINEYTSPELISTIFIFSPLEDEFITNSSWFITEDFEVMRNGMFTIFYK